MTIRYNYEGDISHLTDREVKALHKWLNASEFAEDFHIKGDTLFIVGEFGASPDDDTVLEETDFIKNYELEFRRYL